MKTKLIFAILLIIMAVFAARFLIPILKANYYKFEQEIENAGRELTEEKNGSNKDAETKRIVDKPQKTSDTDDKKQNSSPVSDPYNEYYQKSTKEAEHSIYAEFSKQKLSNIEYIYQRDKSNDTSMNWMNIRGIQIAYRITGAKYYDRCPELEGDKTLMLQPVESDMVDNYKYLLIDVEIDNDSEEIILDLPVNGFYVWLINNNMTVYGCSLLYCTYQPGLDTHVYFKDSLNPGDSIKTSLLFYAPFGGEFENYDMFLLSNPNGSADYSPDLCSLIPLRSIEMSECYETINQYRNKKNSE